MPGLNTKQRIWAVKRSIEVQSAETMDAAVPGTNPAYISNPFAFATDLRGPLPEQKGHWTGTKHKNGQHDPLEPRLNSAKTIIAPGDVQGVRTER